jgi:hypothetical protein
MCRNKNKEIYLIVTKVNQQQFEMKLDFFEQFNMYI